MANGANKNILMIFNKYNMTGDLSKNVLKKIKEDKIEPKPKWIFSLRDLAFWAIFAISLVLGSISTSLIIFILRSNDWDLYKRLGHGLFKFVLITLPYFWLIFLSETSRQIFYVIYFPNLLIPIRKRNWSRLLNIY